MAENDDGVRMGLQAELDGEIAAKLTEYGLDEIGIEADAKSQRSSDPDADAKDKARGKPGAKETGGETKADGEDDRNSNKPELKEKEPKDEEIVEKFPSLARTMQRLSAREQKVAQLEKQLEEKIKGESKPIGNETLAREFRRDPVKALAMLGFNEQEIANSFRYGMAKQLGDKAPEQYKKLREQNELQAQFDQMREQYENLQREVKRRDEVETQRQYVVQYQNELGTYLDGAEENAPLVCKLRATDKEDAMSQIMELVWQDVQMKLASGKRDAAPLTAAEAVAKLEKKLAKYSAAFGSAATTKTSTGSAKSEAGKGTGVNLGNNATRPTGDPENQEEISIDKLINMHVNQLFNDYKR